MVTCDNFVASLTKLVSSRPRRNELRTSHEIITSNCQLYTLLLIYNGPKRKQRQCLIKILGRQTKNIMVFSELAISMLGVNLHKQ